MTGSDVQRMFNIEVDKQLRACFLKLGVPYDEAVKIITQVQDPIKKSGYYEYYMFFNTENQRLILTAEFMYVNKPGEEPKINFNFNSYVK